MNLTPANTRTSFAVTRIDRLIGRVFTLATLLTLIETVMNGWQQDAYLDHLWLGLTLSLLVAVHLYNFINFFFLGAHRFVYLIHGLAYVVAFATWPLQMLDTAKLPADYHPWLWWATGSAAMAVGMYLPKWWVFAYMLFVPVTWVLFHLTPAGGSADITKALADGFYTALFPGTVVGLIWLVREAARKVDEAGELARSEEVERVTLEAQAREQSRLDRLLYSSVFSAIKFAAKAKDKSEYQQAVAASQESLERIELAKNQTPTQISLISFFESLEKLAHRVDEKCNIAISGASEFVISGEVASALSDATIQALTNSIQHAGSKAQRSIRLKGTRSGIKIVVKDTGSGFRPSRVPQHSLGLRLVIFKSVEAIGGEVHIDSKPGHGTTVVLEWEEIR
jgi:signal transduction histidine kinase